jgi:hypothetical protein
MLSVIKLNAAKQSAFMLSVIVLIVVALRSAYIHIHGKVAPPTQWSKGYFTVHISTCQSC